MRKQFPARIHVLLASEATLGLVMRRGPSRQVATLLWGRRGDEFHMGQWLKARIYERRCDLSPDGKYLLYFAMNARWQSETKGAWTAVSRAQIDCAHWEWAELDGQRLVWATGGRLCCGQLTPGGLTAETELFDFNPMAFVPIEAPY